MKKTIVTLTTLAALILAPNAFAIYGEQFGLVPINGGPGSETADVPALPGASEYYWAGACDRGLAPAPGTDLTGLGGLGTLGTSVQAPPSATPVTPPPTPGHCIEWSSIKYGFSFTGPPAGYWYGSPPSWRLPPATQAGSHADGTAVFGQSMQGTLDNIVVELPPGFVGDPGATPLCTQEQFATKPTQCPSRTQVGLLSLLISCVVGCPDGFATQYLTNSPVYNLAPREGNVAELGVVNLSAEGGVTARIVAKARTNGDFGVTTYVGQIPSPLPVIGQSITIWGVPWAAANDVYRAPVGLGSVGNICNQQPGAAGSTMIPTSGLPNTPACRTAYDPSWGPIKPFVSLETECNAAPSTRLAIDAYQFPGEWASDGRPLAGGERLGAHNADPAYSDPIDNSVPGWKVYDSPAPAVTGCGKLGFEPKITLKPTGQGGAEMKAADSATGLDVELSILQNNELPFSTPPVGAPSGDIKQYVQDAVEYWRSDQGLATAHLRETTVTLPAGMTLNPAAAGGQGACSMAEIGVTDTDSPAPPSIRFSNAPVACPDASRVGEVVVETPLLDEADWPEGTVYLAKQGDNPFGSDFAIYIAVESPRRGLIVKLAGEVTPDPATGRLTTTFVQNPELPFDKFRLKFKGGPRAPLATPSTCGTHTSTNQFASHAQPNSPVTVNDPFQVTSSPAGGCAATPEQRPFSLGFSAGSVDIVGGSHSAFTARFTRGDGNQELDRIELSTPEGLAAKLAGVPYCPEEGIAQAISRTASGDGAKEQASPSCPAASKVGTTTIGAGAGSQPFFVKGDVYLAGPYKGAPVSLAFIVPAVAGPFDLGVQVVRTALQVNPKNAQVTAVSDTIPKILRGVPLRLRDVRVDIDRPGFILNPTDCSEMAVSGVVHGASGASTNVSNRFQVAECARLGFKPSLTLRLKGGTKRTKYQGLQAILVPRPGDANIASTSVTMPRSAFLAQEHIRTVCTRVQFAADTCPAGSIYGKATAWSPLLDQPLSGSVYLRSSSNKLPDLVADLRGPASQPIRVEVSGRTDSFKGALRNTFDIVPDAAVTRFELELFGGDKGLIVNSQDLCKKRHFATVKMTGQNGREHNFRPVVKNGCKKIVKPKKAKQGKKGSAKQRPVASLRSLAQIARGLF